MHQHSIEPWRHDHIFLGENHARNERRTWIVVALTAVMMVGEIVSGLVFGSMALLADGIHMATHAGALAIAALAYALARRYAQSTHFTFGSGKFGELAGFSNALILGGVALFIGIESVVRLSAPISIRYDEAIVVAVLGLIINLVCAWLLNGGGHDHHQEDHHQEHVNVHAHAPVDDDHNMRSAYFHVLTDALTSVLAIFALLAGRYFGWVWMDPLMGIVGALVIARWSWGLIRDSGAVLLDSIPDEALVERIRAELEVDGDRISDAHLWRVGPGHIAAVISLVSDVPQPPGFYKDKLKGLEQLSHITIEVLTCTEEEKSHLSI
jgi:cation diffusion facilitator family transporter